MIKRIYEAVDLDTLKSKLGNMCSPRSLHRDAAFVIGPDINDRICQIATCSNLAEAKKFADTLNKNIK